MVVTVTKLANTLPADPQSYGPEKKRTKKLSVWPVMGFQRNCKPHQLPMDGKSIRATENY